MIDKEGLMKEFSEKFLLVKEDIGFNVSFDELEEEFGLRDLVYDMGYVREKIEMQIASRIIDHIRNWAAFLTGILTPSSGSYVGQTEAKLFNSDQDKKEIWRMLKICMKYSSIFSLMFLEKNKEMQKNFFDETYLFWKEDLRPGVAKMMARISEAWGKE